MLFKEKWNVRFFKHSPIIKQLNSFTGLYQNYTSWPSIENYKKIFKQNNSPVTPVSQSENILCFEEQYEPRVYLKNELQTRTENWHDFFNSLIWLKFPQTKKTLNNLHFHQAKNREKGSNRSTLENRITQFDECGAIIISNDNNLLDLIRNHQWQELFINQGEQFKDNIRCVIFGHAIFEKALNPYIGMTCHCILLNDAILLDDLIKGNNKNLDLELSDIWSKKLSIAPNKLNAFPLLGIPGYWPEQDIEFYNNINYFR